MVVEDEPVLRGAICEALRDAGLTVTSNADGAEFAAQVAEQYQRLLDLLGDEKLQHVAVWKMEGLTNEEIAKRLNCSLRTVARKLDTIRIIWNKEPEP